MSCGKRLWTPVTNMLVSGKLRLGKNAKIDVVAADNSATEIDLTELAALNSIAAADLAKIDGITNGTGVAEKALVLDASGNVAMPDNGLIGLSRASVAAAGTDATDATVLADQVNAVTGADGTTGVALPAAATTTGPIFVVNTVLTSGADLKVYPVNGGNDNINALAEDAAFTMGPGKSAWFIPTSATQWYVEDAAGVLTTTTEANILDGVTASAAELNYNDITTLGTVQASKTITADSSKHVAWTATSNSTDGGTSVEVLSVTSTMTGAGGVGGRSKFALAIEAALGGWSNALKGLASYAAGGKTTGMGSAVCAELALSTGTVDGTYAPLEAELVADAAVSTGTSTAFLYGNIAGSDGTGKTTINTNAHLLELGAGVVDTTDGLFDVLAGTQAVTASARLRIKIGGTEYFIPVCAAAALTS